MKKIFVLTGEPSGDKLASEVISKIKTNQYQPRTTFDEQKINELDNSFYSHLLVSFLYESNSSLKSFSITASSGII